MKFYISGCDGTDNIEYIHTRHIVAISIHKQIDSVSGNELNGYQFRMNSGDEIGQILTFTECNVIDINDIELINTND